MKKLIAILVILAMCISTSGISVMAESSEMETALIAVKGKIQIPREAKNFDSRTHTEKNEIKEKTIYTFEWYDDNRNIEISVRCDNKGRIILYRMDKYPDEDQKAFTQLTKEQLFAEADAFVRKAVPELFENPDDCLVYNDNLTRGYLGYRGTSFSFEYERIYKGVPVYDNSLSVTVTANSESMYISYMNSSWYYDVEFDNTPDMEKNITDAYFSAFPVEMIYQKQYSYRPLSENDKDTNKAKLVYRFKDNSRGFISASTGEIKTPETDTYSNETALLTSDTAKGASAENRVVLTEEELNELKEVSGLISSEEAEKMLKAYEELGISNLSITSYAINKQDNKYIINLNMNEKSDSVYHNFYSTFDGKTGEILSLYNYKSTDGESNADTDYAWIVKFSEDFIRKIAPDKVKQCIMVPTKDNYAYVEFFRMVNGIKYINNSIYASADDEHKIITTYSLNWDDDVSYFTDPSQAISESEAKEKMLGIAPIKYTYIYSDKKFIKCVTTDYIGNISIDATSGEGIDIIKESPNPRYTDVSGHWAEKMITALANLGIGLDKSELHPDEAISQVDFLRLMCIAINTSSYYRTCDADELYKEFSDIISKDDRNDNAPVKREDAFYYMIKLMNYGEIADMDIYRSDFSDNHNLSQNRIGAVALLTGFGLVNGFDGMLKPDEYITPAETLTLIYNYISRK